MPRLLIAIISVVLLVLTSLTIVIGGCTSVTPGHTGVVTDWDSTQSWTFSEGFHWHSPIGIDVYEMSTQVQALNFVDEDHLTVLSHDRLQMGMDLSIQYQLNSGAAPRVFQELYNKAEETERYTEVVVEPAARQAIRDVVSRLEALQTVQERDNLGPSIHESISNSVADLLEASGVPRYAIRVVGVQIHDIQLPEQLTESIAAIQQAENAIQQRHQEISVAIQTAERSRVEAEGISAVQIIEAQRDADARRIRASADSDANRLLSQSLTPSLLEYRRIDAQRAILSAGGTRTFVLGGGGRGSTPILDMRSVMGAQ